MKIFMTLLASAAIGSIALAQTQRMILAEEFTQASCPPCASQNPAFNALCDANSDKVIGLHYQVSWPGVDPMNAENATQVASRVSYYGVGSVPHGLFDGTSMAGLNYLGAPANASQTMIDNEYAVPSPFSLNVSHSFSADYDSIFITVNIQAAQAFTSANVLKAHVAIVERNILFSSPPGSNGETDFSWVMRRMLPTESGTTLGLSWTNGQTQVITLSYPLPWYIRNVNQIGVVAFIQQSNTTHTIHQAAFSTPVTSVSSANDASLLVVNVPASSCNPVGATTTLRNTGTATLTSAIIKYQFDVASNWYYDLMNSYLWTGSLAPNLTTLVTIPSTTLSGSGPHTLIAIATLPNGVIDVNPYNSFKQSAISFYSFPSSGSASPMSQDFQASTFPPTNWTLYNPDNSYTWVRYPAAGGFGNSTASARMLFYSSTFGQVDDLYLPSADLQWSLPGVSLTFSVAYAQKVSENDRLVVLVSTNCGQSWTSVYDKAGSTLSTHTPYNSAPWVPTAADWRSDSINLDSYIGNNNLLIKFRATSNLGNNLYLDDVNLQFVTGINQPSPSTSSFDVYPNPANGMLNINLNPGNSQHAVINIYNSIGEVVLRKEIMNATAGIYPVNISGLSSGNYVVQMISDKSNSVQKITVNK